MSHVPNLQPYSERKRYRGHFDGKVVVIDEPADLAPGEVVYIENDSVASRPVQSGVQQGALARLENPEERVAALKVMFNSMREHAGAHVEPERWTRDSFYEDDDQRS